MEIFLAGLHIPPPRLRLKCRLIPQFKVGKRQEQLSQHVLSSLQTELSLRQELCFSLDQVSVLRGTELWQVVSVLQQLTLLEADFVLQDQDQAVFVINEKELISDPQEVKVVSYLHQAEALSLHEQMCSALHEVKVVSYLHQAEALSLQEQMCSALHEVKVVSVLPYQDTPQVESVPQ
jgi:hypothetical protein